MVVALQELYGSRNLLRNFVARDVSAPGMVVLVPITLALFLFVAGLAMLFAVLNVYFRDIEFLLGILLTVWFYLTPVIYPLTNPAVARYRTWFFLNPMVPFTEAY